MDKDTILKVKDFIGAYNSSNSAIDLRNSGKKFTFEEHLESLFFALLSSNYSSYRINKFRSKIIDALFNFDKEEILDHNSKYFIDKLSNITIGCKSIPEVVKIFTSDICVFEELEEKYDSIDNFVTSQTWDLIAKLLSDPKSEYYLQTDQNTICEYLKNVGIDCVTLSSHLKLLFGSDRLGYSQNELATDDEVINAVQMLASDSGISMSEVTEWLFRFGDKHYSNICSY